MKFHTYHNFFSIICIEIGYRQSTQGKNMEKTHFRQIFMIISYFSTKK